MNRCLIAASAAAAFTCLGAESRALTLTIDPQLSSIQVATTTGDDGFGGPYVGQPTAAGGFETTVSGTLEVAAAGSTFQVLAGSEFFADDEELFEPGSAPASFAITYPGVVALSGADLSLATRGLAFSIEDAAARSLTGSTVGGGSPAIALTQGVAELNFGNPPVVPLGFLNLSGSAVSSGPGNYEVVGQNATLTLPFQFTVDLPGIVATTTTYSGNLVATGVIPEPTSAALALGFVGVVSASRSCRR
ncbi:MAG: hypothetical protein AAF743_10545 [Planctomycetota bacterium]